MSVVANGCPPRPASEKDLPFERQRAVRWFDPRQLLATGTQALLASIFGAYADKREMQAALADPDASEVADFSQPSSLWIDYVADTGDGFAATYSVASILARDELALSLQESTRLTRRGEILVMGGDEVYPTPSRVAYDDRLKGPFTAAFPCGPESDAPSLFALPGNHDWYDGLTNFVRLFCQRRWIGGWKTSQQRSYFAIKLPHRWWLWGIDIQFDAYIDEPQLAFFSRIADQDGGLKTGDKVILCTAKPSWLPSKSDQAFENVDFFQRKTILAHGACVPLMLTGDLHHYARYVSASAETMKITAGGGGAFLYPTHDLPGRLNLHEGGSTCDYRLEATYPDKRFSRMLAFGAIALPFKNPGFIFVAGLIYATLAGSLTRSTRLIGMSAASNDTPLSSAISLQPGRLLPLVVLLVVVRALYGFADARRRLTRGMLAVAHLAAHLSVLVGLWHAFVWAASEPFSLPRSWVAFGLVVWMFVFGGAAGSLVVGAYLACVNFLSGLHANECFSAQRLTSHKCFVRMHLGDDGVLTLFPIGIRKVCRRWRLQPHRNPQSPWFEPEETALAPHLIESPVRIS